MGIQVAGGGWGPPRGGGQGGGPPGQPPAGGGGGWGPPGNTPPPGGYRPPPGGYGPPGAPGGHGAAPAPAAGFGAAGGPPPKKGTGAGLIIGVAVAGLVLVGGIVLVVALLLFGRSPPGAKVADGRGGTVTLPAKVRGQADKHLPSGCEAVVRVDVAKALEAPSMQRHIVPALDELEADAPSDPAGKELKELVQRAGIEPRKDLRETLICAIDLEKRGSKPRFAVVFGGDLRPETVVPAFEAVEVPKPESSTFDGRKVATGRDDKGTPLIVGQAADGTVIFANDRVLFEQAAKESDNYRTEYDLPTTSEASFVLGRGFVDGAVGAAGAGSGNPLARDLAAITRVLGIVQLHNPRGEMRITMASARDATRFNQTIQGTILPGFRQQAGRQKSNFGEIEALKAAKSRVDGSDIVIDAPWTTEGVEQAAQELAKQIRQAKAKGF